uniref:Uncharacterized protein AlNc14C5G722 n=1 Tax=Albugo laibachii Nc14 TaxID=890382 RepID=F0W0T7_9STRA|nr:conserved hypothetical protein [Albugo laibachii Nc14]|eukprot:CCA14661.1 conserved hypothetical protein [Albugo laibachii Nc14]
MGRHRIVAGDDSLAVQEFVDVTEQEAENELVDSDVRDTNDLSEDDFPSLIVHKRPEKRCSKDYKGKSIMEWTSIDYAWKDGPVIDTLHFQYVQEEFTRRKFAVGQIRERVLLLSLSPSELRGRRPQTKFFRFKRFLREYFTWLPIPLSSSVTAALDGEILQMKTVLDTHRNQLDARDQYGQLVLNMCIQQQNAPLIQLLIERGANLNLQNRRDQFTPMHTAILMDNKSLVQRLISLGSNVDAKDREGLRPLHWATIRGHLELVAQFISISTTKHDTSFVNEGDCYGWTPLHIACLLGHTEVVEYLISRASAKIDVEDMNGFTPMLFARISGHSSLEMTLKNYMER